MSVAPLPFNHTRTFTRDRYNRYDTPAKEASKSLLTQMGYEVVDEREGYGSHDFIVAKGGKEFKVEAEMKTCWEFRQFPYRTHRVSHRKHTSRADLFLQVSKNGKYIALCPMSAVLGSPVVLRDTCFGTKDEPFFDVATSAMKYYECDGGVWYEEVDD
jgi:hypothetical protein